MVDTADIFSGLYMRMVECHSVPEDRTLPRLGPLLPVRSKANKVRGNPEWISALTIRLTHTVGVQE